MYGRSTHAVGRVGAHEDTVRLLLEQRPVIVLARALLGRVPETELVRDVRVETRRDPRRADRVTAALEVLQLRRGAEREGGGGTATRTEREAGVRGTATRTEHEAGEQRHAHSVRRGSGEQRHTHSVRRGSGEQRHAHSVRRGSGEQRRAQSGNEPQRSCSFHKLIFLATKLREISLQNRGCPHCKVFNFEACPRLEKIFCP